MLKSKIVRETLKEKGYDLDEVESRKTTVGHNSMRVLAKLADDKPVVSTRRNDEPDITIMRWKQVSRDENPLKNGESENKEVVRIPVENIPEDIHKQTTLG